MTLDEAKAAPEGTAAIYAPEGGQPEPGWITGTSDTMVFVRYGADSHSKATRPEDLAFAFVSDAMLARKAAGSGRLPAAAEGDDCGCGLGPERCAAAEDGDLGGC